MDAASAGSAPEPTPGRLRPLLAPRVNLRTAWAWPPPGPSHKARTRRSDTGPGRLRRTGIRPAPHRPPRGKPNAATAATDREGSNAPGEEARGSPTHPRTTAPGEWLLSR